MTYKRFKENIETKILEVMSEIEIAKRRGLYERLEEEIIVLKSTREAVEKQTPVETLKLKRDVDTKIGNGTFKAGVTVYKCPCCNTFVTPSRKYCDQCGQALKYTK